MKKSAFLILLMSVMTSLTFGQYDWDNVPVPADPGDGKTWELQENVSDDFNYIFNATDEQVNFGDDKWYNFYHNPWDGPGRTYWQHDHISVNGSELVVKTSDSQDITKGFNCANTGCISSNNRVSYPVFVEGSISVANVQIASDIWMLSPDDTEEIDIIECYGGHEWFGQFIHLSHHSFIRSPFHDYQPRDVNSWYPDDELTGGSWGEYCWNNGDRQYIRVGVNWIGPNHFEYYVNGQLARVLYENATATMMYGEWEYTYYNDQYPDGTTDEYGTNLGGMPTTTDGYTDVTLYTTTDTYDFATLQAASAASNNIKVVDPGAYQGEGVGFTKELDIIINVEIQNWHLDGTWLIDDADLADPISDMHVDWIRAYKPVTAANNVDEVNIVPSTISTGIGQNRTLSVNVLPSNAIDKSVTWSSTNESVVTVDEFGTITGVSEGTATIKATSNSGNIVGSCTVSVQSGTVPVPVSNINIAAPRLEAQPGDELALKATILPSDASNQSLTWTSSNPSVATVDPSTGLVTGVANGSVTITARTNDGTNISKSINLSFEKYIPAGITVHNAQDLTTRAFVVGSDLTLTCDYNAGSGNVVDETGVTFILRRMTAGWANVVSTYSVADLSTVGTQSGTASGTITLNVPTSEAIGSDFYFIYVYINEGGFSSPGILPITIVDEEIPLTSVTITPETISTGIGQTRGLTIEKLPALSTDPTITWSSDNENIVSVDQDGNITGVGVGTTKVRATSNNNIEDICTVTVQQEIVPIAVTSIAVSASSQSGKPGDNITLSSVAYPDEATNKAVTWSSSDPSVATVDPLSGSVTAKDYGSVYMIATANDGSGVTGSIELRIETDQEARITVSDANSSKYVTTAYAVGGEINVTADYHAGTGNVIDGNGITFWLRRIKDGWTSVVEGSDITVSDVSAAGTEFGTASASIPLDGVTPSDEIGTDFYFLWISANGNSIVHDGFYPIIITDDVTPVTDLTVSISNTNLSYAGETVTAVATITPDNASNKTVTWSSSNDAVASVNATTGVVTALTNGTATITAVSNDNSSISDSKVVTVDIEENCGDLTEIEVIPAFAEIKVGDSEALSFAATPACQTPGTDVTWTSNNTSVATVNAGTGVVTGIGKGTAVITATTTDNLSLKATCSVSVIEQGSSFIIEAEDLTTTGGTYDDSGSGGPGFGMNISAVGVNYVNSGDWAEYDFSVPADGVYEITYYISTPSDNTEVSLYIDGGLISTDAVTNNGQWDDYQQLTASGTASLPAGDYTLKIEASGSNDWQWNLDKIELSKVSPLRTTGIDSKSADNVKIFPNPASSVLYIQIDNPETYETLQLISYTGQVLIKEPVQADVNKRRIDVSYLERGMYIIKLSGKKTRTISFIKD